MRLNTKYSKNLEILQAAQAKAFLEKLAEYKPLAKVEEMEEQNFNMIDNTLNNLKKKEEPYRQEETKQPDGKYKSLRERLEEKKKIIASKESSFYVGPSLDL